MGSSEGEAMTTKATAQMGGLTREQVEEWRNALCDYNRWTDEGISEIDQLCDLALQAIDRWVPVSERLPEQGSTVLIFLISDEGTNIADIANQNDDERGFFIRGTFWEWKYATHWMPLPPPPPERP